MQSNRLLIIVGVVLLQIMLLAAVFALGIYVGRYGLTEEGLVYSGPGGRAPAVPGKQVDPQQGGAPNQATPANKPSLPPGLTEPPQVLGRLVNITPDSIEIASPQGPRPVLVDENTVYEDTEGNTFTLADLRRGMILGIYGMFDQNGRNLVAKRVVILPLPEEGQGQQPQQPAP